MHKKSIIIITLLMYSCSSIQYSSSEKQKETIKSSQKDIEFKRDSLAFELCKIYGLDQGIRNSSGFKGKGKLISAIDTFNFERVIDFIKVNGVPDAELVGERNFNQECVQASWIAVLLHNPHRLVKDEANLNFFVELVNDGQIKEETLILILDKYYWAKSGGKDVLYGSQFGKPCIQHQEKTNQARKAIGASELPDSLFKDCSK